MAAVSFSKKPWGFISREKQPIVALSSILLFSFLLLFYPLASALSLISKNLFDLFGGKWSKTCRETTVRTVQDDHRPLSFRLQCDFVYFLVFVYLFLFLESTMFKKKQYSFWCFSPSNPLHDTLKKLVYLVRFAWPTEEIFLVLQNPLKNISLFRNAQRTSSTTLWIKSIVR